VLPPPPPVVGTAAKARQTETAARLATRGGEVERARAVSLARSDRWDGLPFIVVSTQTVDGSSESHDYRRAGKVGHNLSAATAHEIHQKRCSQRSWCIGKINLRPPCRGRRGTERPAFPGACWPSDRSLILGLWLQACGSIYLTIRQAPVAHRSECSRWRG